MNINNSNINISLSNMVSYKIYKHLKVLILEYLVLKVLTLLIFTIWINWDLRLWYRWRRGWSRKKESRNNQNHIRHKWPQSLKQPRVGSSCWAALLSALLRISPNSSATPESDMTSQMESYLRLFVEETTFYNRFVLATFLPAKLWEPLPHFFQTWLRNYIGGTLVYFISGLIWCFYIYYWKRNVFVPKGADTLYFTWIFYLFSYPKETGKDFFCANFFPVVGWYVDK